MIETKVTLKGIPELRAAFEATADDIPAGADRRLAPVLDQVVTIARQELPSDTGAARDDIRAQDGSIVFGSVAYEPWLDFGGNVGIGGSVRRPYVKSGRAVYPALGKRDREITEAVGDGALDAAAAHGFEVNR